MNKLEKNQLIEDLAVKLRDSNVVYLTDVSAMTVEKSNKLRRMCFNQNISLQVVKNTLLKKAMERVEERDFSGLYEALTGNTSIMLSDTGNAPAKLIKDFRKKETKPALKGAYIDEAIFIGEDKKNVGWVYDLINNPLESIFQCAQCELWGEKYKKCSGLTPNPDFSDMNATVDNN